LNFKNNFYYRPQVGRVSRSLTRNSSNDAVKRGKCLWGRDNGEKFHLGYFSPKFAKFPHWFGVESENGKQNMAESVYH
jgi:hypothetical protein